jgi:acyl-CoA reductase-like NAD-dependent aldehyde dehydrogenase
MLLKPGTSWEDVFSSCRSAAPEAFDAERVLNLWGGEWRSVGTPHVALSPVDGSAIIGPPMIEVDQAHEALQAAVNDHRAWAVVPLDERRSRVRACLEHLSRVRETLALLLVWEIGKPYRQSLVEVDRTISGVEWYLDNIEWMLQDRRPLQGPVSNIASWNYPLSVLVHSMLVQVLAGNAAIAKAPTDGGVCSLTLSLALARREGLPVSLISGSGGRLSPVLVQDPAIGCLAFVGGRDAGGQIASHMVQTDKRHMLEQEGLNAWGVWEFTRWDELAVHLKKGFEYAKQRCTAYPRYVVQRSRFDQFLEMYLPVLQSLVFGHPLAVERADDDPPDIDFGPVINSSKASELEVAAAETVDRGGIPLYRRSLADGRFLPGQDTSSYVAPVAILDPPRISTLYHAEPFGPIDTIVLVDTPAELLAAMNVSNGALVASLACDDEELAAKLAAELHAFKIGINRPRSRGDREEPFGGRGASWKGAFVGGEHLVRAVTEGPPGDRLYGNFPDYQHYPAT